MNPPHRQTIVELLDAYGKKVFSSVEIVKFLESQPTKLGFAKSTPVSKMLRSLVEAELVSEVRCKCPSRSSIIRYTLPGTTPHEVALSFAPQSFLSHRTAAVLHGLIKNSKGPIIVNIEQSPKPQGGKLTQDGIDAAFSRPQRKSNALYSYGRNRILVLNGKHTGRLGVGPFRSEGGQLLQISNLERTLLDLVVRPAYSGGASSVLGAFKRGKGKSNVQSLAQMLGQMNYIYPYHQAAGFYVDRAGYGDAACELFMQHGTKFDFYLEHYMENPRFDKRWRVSYPAALDG
jgi:hypothetical protein